MAKEIIILFDLDGTLIESSEAICESFIKACKENHLNIPTLEAIKKSIGYTLEDMFLGFGATKDSLESCIDSYRSHYREIYLDKTTLLPQALPSLKLAKEFAYLGVVTTKTAKYSLELLNHLKIVHFFETIVGIEDVKFPKPNKEPILKAISNINRPILLSNIFMIGDTILDIKSALNAKINPIGVKTGYGDKKEMSLFCQEIFDDVLEALEYIKNLRKNL